MEKLGLQVIIDRPMGYQDSYGNVYPLNYGYVPGIIGGDGEKQDVYIISKQVTGPIQVFEGVLVAIIHRQEDVETKWVATAVGETISAAAIKAATHYLEQYFESTIEML